jgi:hypothetical protein
MQANFRAKESTYGQETAQKNICKVLELTGRQEI